MFCLGLVVIIWVYTYVRIHPAVHTLWFVGCGSVLKLKKGKKVLDLWHPEEPRLKSQFCHSVALWLWGTSKHVSSFGQVEA